MNNAFVIMIVVAYFCRLKQKCFNINVNCTDYMHKSVVKTKYSLCRDI